MGKGGEGRPGGKAFLFSEKGGGRKDTPENQGRYAQEKGKTWSRPGKVRKAILPFHGDSAVQEVLGLGRDGF